MRTAHQGEDGIWSIPALHEHLEGMITSTGTNLRDHITQQIAQTAAAITAQEKSTALALAALNAMLAERDKALRNAREEQREAENKAEQALSLRLENFNEWRALVNGERSDLVRLEVFVQAITDLNQRVDDRFTQAAERGDERMANLLALIERANVERRALRDELNAVTIRQATEDRGKGDGRQRIDLIFTGVGVFASLIVGIIAIVLHFLP